MCWDSLTILQTFLSTFFNGKSEFLISLLLLILVWGFLLFISEKDTGKKSERSKEKISRMIEEAKANRK